MIGCLEELQVVGTKPEEPRCFAIVRKGIHTARDFANLMDALLYDLATGRIPPEQGNAMCNAGGKLLKVCEMEARYGRALGTTAQDKTLILADASK